MDKNTKTNLDTLRTIADSMFDNFVIIADAGSRICATSKKRDNDTLSLMAQYLSQPENMAYIISTITMIGKKMSKQERKEFLTFVASEMNIEELL